MQPYRYLRMKLRMRTAFPLLPCVALSLMIGFLSSCGGSSATPVPPPTNLFVKPSAATVVQGGTQLFATGAQVKWSVQEGVAGGSVSDTGSYTAPNAAGTYHVVATSTDGSVGKATVTVPAVAISASVNSVPIAVDDSVSMSNFASVSGTVNTKIIWAVQEGSAGGSISLSAVYTAPSTLGTYHVVAKSEANPQETATIEVVVQEHSVQVFPASDVLGFLGTRTFIGQTNSYESRAITWSLPDGAASGTLLDDPANYNRTTYTAPSAAGTYHVLATINGTSATQAATVKVISSGFRPSSGQISDTLFSLTATILVNGKVLVAGGDACYYYYYYDACPTDRSELYDPANDSFTPAANMNSKRSYHTATLLQNGKVLLAGGGTATSELYDPTANTFTPSGSMAVSRWNQTATRLQNDKVLIVGGTGIAGILATAEVYDPGPGTFSSTGSMSIARVGHTATLLPNGTVLIAGGLGPNGQPAKSELYDPSAGTFSSAGNMVHPRGFHAATLLANGKVLIVGGQTPNSAASAELFDPATNQFASTGDMIAARNAPFAVRLLNGTVLVSGGNEYSAEIYDSSTGLFTQTGSMNWGRYNGATALLNDGQVLVVGGGQSSVAELYK